VMDARLKHLFFFGRPLAPLYSALMVFRSNLYRRGILQQRRLEVPVISVGNLMLGGTGKTPMVQYIAKFLKQHARKPVILSRGYKGSAGGTVNVVSTTTDILLDALEAGDEPRLLAEKMPGTPVITGRNRFTTGRFAIDSFGADILILDDGFQHLSLQRDLDLVLFNGQKRLGNGRVLPGGELREPLSALTRAHAFIITGAEDILTDNVKEFIRHLGTLHPEKPIFTGTYQPENMLRRIHNGKSDFISQENARKLPLYGFCGIAGPESFRKTLETTGMSLAGFHVFEDHHAYSSDNIQFLLNNAKASRAAGLVTTEKDVVKLHSIFPPDFPLLILPVQLHLSSGFDRFLTDRLNIITRP